MILSAGIIPLRKKGKDWEVLLLRCFSYWDFPKGEVEAGEDSLESALRELTEETGLSQLRLTFGKEYRDTEVYGRSKVARYYLAEILEEKKIALEPNPVTGIIEHHEARWMGFEDASALLVPRVRKILEWAKEKITSP